MGKKILKPLIALIVFVLFASLFIFISPGSITANPGVKIKGTVYYYNFEQGGIVNNNMSVFGNITGGRYVKVEDIYVEVEFEEWTIEDVPTVTDNSGYYEVVVRNPAWGSWHVNIEIEAKVKPDSSNSSVIDCYEDSTDYFAYNFQTGSRAVGKNGTLVFNVYIGGPSNNIESWWDADITSLWDDGAGDGKNHMTAIFITQAINDIFDWATWKAPSRSELLSRDTYVMFPSDETGIFGFFSNNNNQYKPYHPPPGIGHIHIIPINLYPGQFDDPELVYEIGHHWERLRFILAHEYGHKIMHDVYWAWPSSLSDWNVFDSSSHGTNTFSSPELAWLEGWAEFFAAAYMDKPSIPSELSNNQNIEITHDPNALNGVLTIGSEDIMFRWANTILDSSNDGKRHKNEGTVAAILWDIYDPRGWEYMSQKQQNTFKPHNWPSDLKWHDNLNDNNLNMIWPILRDNNPDCLLDEGDLWLDSFFYYWDRKYKNNKENIHGLKAIMYNRGIITAAYPQNAPSVDEVSIDSINNKLNFTITELNKEDQPYLFFNIAYRPDDSADYIILYPVDHQISNYSTSWVNNSLSVSVPQSFPIGISSYPANDFIVMVHDNMGAGYLNYQDLDIIRIFYGLINEGQTQAAASMLSSSMAQSEAIRQQYKEAFDGFESVEVLNVETFNKNTWTDTYRIYKVLLDVQKKPEYENILLYENGENIRWVSIVKTGSIWEIDYWQASLGQEKNY